MREIDESEVPEQAIEIGPATIGLNQRGPAFVPTVCNGWNNYKRIFNGRKKWHFPSYAAYYHFKNKGTVTNVRVLGIDPDDNTNANLVFGHAGFKNDTNESLKAYAVVISSSAANKFDPVVHSIVHASGTVSVVAGHAGLSECSMSIEDYMTTTLVTSDNTKKNYLRKICNTDPTLYPDSVTGTKKHYVWETFDYLDALDQTNVFPGYTANKASNAQLVLVEISGSAPSGSNYSYEYTTPQTPVITSQNFGSDAAYLFYELFTVYHLSDGIAGQNETKLEFRDIKASVNPSVNPYGTFTILVRAFSDTDKNPVILESFTGLTLDPDSPNWILRRIGDTKRYYNTTKKAVIEEGEWPNKSNYIRISISSDLKNGNVPEEALPYGYGDATNGSYPRIGTAALAISTSLPAFVPPIPLQLSMVWKGEYKSFVSWGPMLHYTSGSDFYDFTASIQDRLKKCPANVALDYDRSFNLTYLSSSDGAITASQGFAALTSTEKANVTYNRLISPSTVGGNISFEALQGTEGAKFKVLFYGGFDGFNIHYENPLDNYLINLKDNSNYNTTSNWYKSSGIASLRRAIDTLNDPDTVDITDLYIPNIFHPAVTNYALELCADRGDVFYVPDVSGSQIGLTSTPDGTPANAITWMEAWLPDTNYGACYFGAGLVYDSDNLQRYWQPPSVAMSYVFSFNDKNGGYWKVPAGMIRGRLDPDWKKIHYYAKNTSKNPERDNLMQANVNTIGKIQNQLVVWGQKNLQLKQSILDRVAPKRMLIYLKKAVAAITYNFVFEENVEDTWSKWKNTVRPTFDFLASNFGLVPGITDNGVPHKGYEIIMDKSTTSNVAIANHEMYGTIVLYPAEAAEKIIVGFVIRRSGDVGFAETAEG